MPGLRERNKRMKLQRIIAEARQLFVRQGFAETTTQYSSEGVVISCDSATPCTCCSRKRPDDSL
jgi:hypothetical protein